MNGQDYTCEKCGRTKRTMISVCFCELPADAKFIDEDGTFTRDEFEKKVNGLPYSEEKIELPYNPTKKLFLEKCFGDWFEKSNLARRREPAIREAALTSWLCCAERFNVPKSDVPFLAGNFELKEPLEPGTIQVYETERRVEFLEPHYSKAQVESLMQFVFEAMSGAAIVNIEPGNLKGSIFDAAWKHLSDREELAKLQVRYEEAVQWRDWQSCDLIGQEIETLKARLNGRSL